MNDNNELLIDNKETSVVSSLKNDSYISNPSKDDINDHRYSNVFYRTSDVDKPRTSNNDNNNNNEDKKDNNNNNQPLSLFGSANTNNTIPNKKIKVISFQDESQNNIHILHRKKFAIVSNDLVTTYLIGNESFSQFTHPKTIEHDKRVNVFILEKQKHKDEYICNDINELISNLGIDNNSSELSKNVQLFIQKINEIFLNKNYISIKRCHSCWVLLCILIILSLLSIAVLSALSLEPAYISKRIIKLSSEMLLLLIFIMCVLICLMIYYLTSMALLLKFKKMNYMYKMYKDNVALVNKWNKSIFEVNGIKVSIPPSLDYIVFNKDMSHDIQICNINLEHIKIKFNPSLTVEPIVFKDDNKIMEGGFHNKENV